uniref:Uncharacterized protein n=1 Tax=Schistosoma japonicum TaxID=6182 RepID=Q5BX98_SCHJA|nr:unknown [Schistosoma japonicum]
MFLLFVYIVHSKTLLGCSIFLNMQDVENCCHTLLISLP